MEQEEFVRKAEYYISLFDNGEDRYRKSALFNRVIQMLVRGENPYEVIDILCNTVDEQNKLLEKSVTRSVLPPITVTDKLKI